MIIQIRGTCGSGKTWAIKNWMESYLWDLRQQGGRIYYTTLFNEKRLVVLGNYEHPFGGCDTIGGTANEVNAFIQSLTGDIFVCEAFLLSEDSDLTPRMGQEIKVIYLTTKLKDCVENVLERKRSLGITGSVELVNNRNQKAIKDSKEFLSKVPNVTVFESSSFGVPKLLNQLIR